MRANEHLDAQEEVRVGVSEVHALSGWAGLLPTVCFTQTSDGSFTMMTSAALEVTGVPDGSWLEESVSFWECVHEMDVESVKAHWDLCLKEPGVVKEIQYRLRSPSSGQIEWIRERRRAVPGPAGPTHFQATWTNTTVEQTARERLPFATWPRSLAFLTPGVAHDLNNQFASILALSDGFVRKTAPGHPFHENSKVIRDSVQQSARLVQQLVAAHLSRLGEYRYHDLNELVRDTFEFLRHATSRRFDLKSEFAPGSLPIYADHQAIKRCLIAVAKNAVEAIPAPAPGQITVTTSHEASIPLDLRPKTGRRNKSLVSVAIHNNGPSISEQQRGCLFHRWFTTKPPSEGSGMSLFWVRECLEAHGGSITLDPPVDSGVTFRFWLPVSDFTEADQPPSPTAKPRVLLTGRPPALDEAAEGLRTAGFRVTATDGHALEIINSTEEPYDGLVMLQSLAEGEIRDLTQRIRARRWKTKLIREATEPPPTSPTAERAETRIPFPVHHPEHCAKLRAVLAPQA